jgi:outer membrane protein TolC
MKTNLRTFLVVLLSVFTALQTQAQNSQGTANPQTQAFSLQQAIEYALQNQERIKIARNETQIAKAKIGEIRSIGLPQINLSAELGNNFILPKTLLPAAAFAQPQYQLTQQNINDANDGKTVVLGQYQDPASQGDSDKKIALSFMQPWSGTAAISASQLLFDGSYLIGLKAASTYSQLSTKQLVQTEIEVTEQVSKAYYGVLVSNARRELLEQNLRRLDTLLYQTKQLNKNGFAEKLDVDRLTVTYNNLKIEKQKTDRLIELSQMLLKFQMGMEQTQPIILTDKLADVEVDINKTNTQNFNYSNRIEYAILETQRDLATLDIRNVKAGYYPKLMLTGRYGYNGFSGTFTDLATVRGGANNVTDRNWFDFGYIGLGLQIPVFDGLNKHYKGQQARLRLESAKSGLKLTQQSIDLQLNSSSINLTNALQQLESQKQTMALAEDIARVAKIKYQEGVGTNLEVINAETDLRTAQTNYYASLYDALVAKVDLDKATGTLK